MLRPLPRAMPAGAQGDAGGCREGDHRFRSAAAPGLVVGALAQVAHRLGEGLAGLGVVGEALVGGGVVAQAAGEL